MDTSSGLHAATFERHTGDVPQRTEPHLMFYDPAKGRFWSQSLIAEAERRTPSTVDVSGFLLTPQEAGVEQAQDPAGHLSGILGRLNAVRQLQSNWDSYGAEPPTPAAVSEAVKIVWTIVARHFPSVGDRAIPFTVAPLSRGVQVEWRGETDCIEVQIGAGGELGYLLVRGQGDLRGSEERDSVQEADVLGLIATVIA